MSDFYNILGIDKGASEDQIKKAYRTRAMKSHPDRGGNEEEFKQLGRAYEVLSDSNKRRIYDNHGEKGLEEMGQGRHADPSELFNMFFKHTQQQNTRLNVLVGITVTLKDLYIGCNREEVVKRNRKCRKCKGYGYSQKNDGGYKCNSCNGVGHKMGMRQLGPIVQAVRMLCDQCHGKGHTAPDDILCKTCNSTGMEDITDTFEVTIVPGMVNNQQIQVDNEGHEDKDGNTGDLIFVLQEEPHDSFKRIGNNLLYSKTITLGDALCGTEFILDFVNDKPLLVKSKIVVNPLHTYKLVGWGMPIYDTDNEKGDLIIDFEVTFPTKNEIKPEFKKHIKKFLKLNDTETDTAGYRSATLIEVQEEDMHEFHPNMQHDGEIPQAQCAHQ